MSRLAAFGLHRPELRAWAMYDWANSAFVTSVITVFYPVYFASNAQESLTPVGATERFAYATTVALAISAVLSPLLGFLADRHAVRKRMLAGCLSLALLTTVAMALAPAQQWGWSLTFFALANVGASLSFVFYDSLLPHIARPHEIDRVSSAGYAVGYLGGGSMLALNVLMVMRPGLFGLSDASGAMRWVFLSVALWWAVFSIPLFRRVSEPPPSLTPEQASQGVWIELRAIFGELKTFDQAFLMLLAFLVYNDGIGTIIRMTTVYGSEIGIDRTTQIMALLMVQFLGIPCTYLIAALATRFGSKLTIGFTLLVYALVTWVAYGMTTPREFWILAALVAFAQGGCQALSRSLFASMIPERQSSRFFAFFAVAEKFAGVFGSAIFALLISATGETRLAVLSLVVFFLVGAVLLSLVNVEKGRAHAAQANALQV
jgi:UMF1 family MFS transporter